MRFKLLLNIVSVFLCGILTQRASAQTLFASGEWLKIGVTQSGVHKLDADVLSKLNFKNVNSRSLRLYGSTQRQLPQENTASLAELKEVSLEINDADGQFSANDFLLFYAEGPHIVRATTTGTFTHQTHAYCDTAYYFLKINDVSTGQRISKMPANVTPDAPIISTFDDVFVREDETVNLEKSGREWFGNFFSTQISFTVPLEGIVPNSDLKIQSSVLGNVRNRQNLEFLVNNVVAGNHALTASLYDARDAFYQYSRRGFIDNQLFVTQAPGGNVSLNYRFPTALASPSGAYLNYFLIHSQRNLRFYDNQTTVRSFKSLANEASTFLVDNHTASQRIWDISDGFDPKFIEPLLIASRATFTVSTKNTLKTFLLFSENNVLSPSGIRRMANQNISTNELPDLLIVSPKAFLPEVNRLAKFRREHDKLTVNVASVEELYNAYAGGMIDPTAIRNHIRELWKKSPQKLKYVLLFGDATFDYKDKLKLAENGVSVSVPTYESRESLEPVYSHASDDYFGFLEAAEGFWREGESRFGRWDDGQSDDYTLDVGIGRLPVRNISQAKQVVDKLIYYDLSPKRFGSWRNQVSFVADDEDAGFDYNIHLKDADRLAQIATENDGGFFLNKIYLGAYPQTATPNGNRSPEARKNLDKAVEEGSLIVNYNGHGSEDGWTDEKILTIEQLLRWRNLNNLPIMLTATCEFGRYDNPGVVSGAELALLNARGGGIGLLTTTRPVYSNTNFLLNSAFYESIGNLTDQQPDAPPRMGDIFRLTKNGSVSGTSNRNFVFLGDPSMQLALPPNKVKLLKINGSSPEKQQLKALEKVTLSGEIGIENFNGNVKITVYDKPSTLQTLPQNSERIASFNAYRNVIFNGVATVMNGQFNVNFIVPKDIDYRIGPGKMHFYAVNSDSTADVAGNFINFTVGGSEEIMNPDITPPTITLKIDGENVLTAVIRDASGINLSRTGIGHEILLTLNDTMQIIGNPYFISGENFSEGVLRYAFGSLPPGQHTVKLKIWDVYNNAATESLTFTVEPPTVRIEVVSLFPNPSDGLVNFEIIHSADDRDVNFFVQFYNISGQVVYETSQSCYFCDASYRLTIDTNGKVASNGSYFYRIGIEEESSGQRSYTTGRVIFWN